MTEEQIRNTKRLIWQAVAIYGGACLPLGALVALFK